MAAWLSRSFSSAPTIRGKNWPMASCTATSVRLSTTLVNVTSAGAAVLRIVCTSAGVPVTAWLTSA
jgi:hypothetical protein